MSSAAKLLNSYMGILIVVVLLGILVLIGLLFVVKWLFKKKERLVWLVAVLAVIFLGKVIGFLFFSDMEFVQSKVYNDLYLVKNPISNRDSLDTLIRKTVVRKMAEEFVGNENKYKWRDHHTSDNSFEYNYSLRYYEYYKGWGSSPFGEAGTEHFLEHSEDPGGFSSELLEYYDKYKIAEFDIIVCKKDTNGYVGLLRYFKNEELVKTDTIIDLCKNRIVLR